ncbi:calcium-binding protein [Streptomyces sp. NPDC089424]|uniref:calcium-binding protein n=1 Tax=Streptomyces sp. NPDC089424 TaxID=3365917 RepID=UPI00380A146B
MRRRPAVAVLGTAAALAVYAVPGAQADEHHGDTRITQVVMNNGKGVAVGTGGKLFGYRVTGTDNSGLRAMEAWLWRGTDINRPTAVTGGVYSGCTRSTCSVGGDIEPRRDGLVNADAGTWRVRIALFAQDDDYRTVDQAATVQVLRIAKITTGAFPASVKKGYPIVVSGDLIRADWEQQKYVTFGNQEARLQFRPANSGSFRTVKIIKGDADGFFRTTVRATADGYWRLRFWGSSTTAAASNAGAYVDVR